MCGSSARTDLCGGRPAMVVPTATGTGTLLEVVELTLWRRRSVTRVPLPPLVQGLSSGSLESPASSLRELRHLGLDRGLPQPTPIFGNRGTKWRNNATPAAPI